MEAMRRQLRQMDMLQVLGQASLFSSGMQQLPTQHVMQANQRIGQTWSVDIVKSSATRKSRFMEDLATPLQTPLSPPKAMVATPRDPSALPLGRIPNPGDRKAVLQYMAASGICKEAELSAEVTRQLMDVVLTCFQAET